MEWSTLSTYLTYQEYLAQLITSPSLSHLFDFASRKQLISLAPLGCLGPEGQGTLKGPDVNLSTERSTDLCELRSPLSALGSHPHITAS